MKLPKSALETAVLDAAWADDVVRGLYRQLLGREPEGVALAHWGATLRQLGGTDAGAGVVAAAIVGSEEYRQRTHNLRYQGRVLARVPAVVVPLLGETHLTLVDVGAQKLTDEDHVYSPLVAAGLPCEVIGFEPLQEKIAQQLSLPQSENAPITLYPQFIGDGNRHVFHINNEDATSSLLPLNQALCGQLLGLSHLATVRTEAVSTRTLDNTLPTVTAVDFLKLDIQGFELTALQHATTLLQRTQVVHCEVSFAEIYRQQALFSEVEQWLRQNGFAFVDFSNSCRYAYRGAVENALGSEAASVASSDRLGWGDAVFFKCLDEPSDQQDADAWVSRDSAKAAEAPRALLVQGLVALYVYRKFTLAAQLWARYDRLTGANLCAVFRID